MQDIVYIYRGRLPHWRLDRSTYFVTWRLRNHQPALEPEERDVVAGALKYFEGDRYKLSAYVVMDDHVHVLVTPLGHYRLEHILHSWKSYTSHILRRGSRGIWQRESYDRIVRNETEYLDTGTYILANPWRRWPQLTEYKWMGPDHAIAPGG